MQGSRSEAWARTGLAPNARPHHNENARLSRMIAFASETVATTTIGCASVSEPRCASTTIPSDVVPTGTKGAPTVSTLSGLTHSYTGEEEEPPRTKYGGDAYTMKRPSPAAVVGDEGRAGSGRGPFPRAGLRGMESLWLDAMGGLRSSREAAVSSARSRWLPRGCRVVRDWTRVSALLPRWTWRGTVGDVKQRGVHATLATGTARGNRKCGADTLLHM